MLIFFVVLAFMSCGRNEKDKDDGKQLHDWAAEYGNLGGGLVVGLVKGEEPTENGVVFLEKISDMLNIQFANLTENDSEYMLKLFYDYEETLFASGGGDTLQKDYIFAVDSMTSMIIPVMLDENLTFDNSHFLTVAVLTAPGSHAVDLDLMSNEYGYAVTFELSNKNAARQVNNKPAVQESAAFLQLQYQGLMLNLDFEAKDDEPVFFPPKELRASSGETVTLTYRAGNYDADDVLFVVMVGWEPQIISGNSPYMYIANKPGFMSYGTIKITAPMEKGKYEITGFIDASPFELREAGNFWGNEFCYRFTLVVE